MGSFEDKSIEKRLGRIERWLKRCMVACKCGSWSSALMEIECMEAETREFRSEVWLAAQEEAGLVKRRTLRENTFRSCKVAAIAMVMVMAIGIPLSLEQDRPFQAFSGDSLAVLTSTESDILAALRENLSSLNEGRVLLSVEMPVDSAPEIDGRGAAAAAVAVAEYLPTPGARAPAPVAANRVTTNRRPVVRVTTAPRTVPSVAATEQRTVRSGPTVEEVISLIQVGQRALRASEPAIRVIE